MSSVMQNPNQKSYPNPHLNPASSPNPHQKPAPPKSSKPLTYDEVSKLFSLPLSDAADSLGICTSVLRKFCHENGLARWPYRKLLLGKSIEQIKEEAARERAERLNEGLKDSVRAREDFTNSAAASLQGPQLHNKPTSSNQELLKSQTFMQPQGNKNLQTGVPQVLQGSNFTKGYPAETDEFIYGFPSDGLSTVSYRWWGKTSSNVSTDSSKKVLEDTSVDSNSASKKNGEELLTSGHDFSSDSLESGSLSSLRKRAAEEGWEALKRGVHRRFAANKLTSTKTQVLQQIFKSSLPTDWSSESF